MSAHDPDNGNKGYQWPADQLTASEMAILHRLRQATGIPINHLVKQAILRLEQSLATNAAGCIKDASANYRKEGEHDEQRR